MFHSSSRRGGALAAVLIGLAVIAGLIVVVAVGAGVFVARHVHVQQSSNKTLVETPFGSIRVRRDAKFDPAQFGVPLYPGAVREEDSRKLASFELDLGEDHHEFTVLAAQYTTSDPAGKVAAFYREKLPSWTVVNREGRHGEHRFEFSGRGFRRVVEIHEEGGMTRIALASVGEPAAN